MGLQVGTWLLTGLLLHENLSAWGWNPMPATIAAASMGSRPRNMPVLSASSIPVDDGSAGGRVMIVGEGGREHCIAWSIARKSKGVDSVLVAPGNGGTAGLASDGVINLNIPSSDLEGIVEAATRDGVDLVVIGPEAPLVSGLADSLRTAGVAVVGPGAAAARLEGSKAWAKLFMDRHGVPTAMYQTFTNFEEGRDFLLEARTRSHRLRSKDHSMAVTESGVAREGAGWAWGDLGVPPVVKASGLAAGKGVVVPSTWEEALEALRMIMVDKAFGEEAGAEVVIEERLEGPEVSVMAFCDGELAVCAPGAQDHKRALEGDRGPNTGGMGAYCPAPYLVDAPSLREEVEAVMQKVVTGMAKEGNPYHGVLFGGFVLTSNGPKVLEFNCRLGDPEAQAILPLLEGDLYELCRACASGGGELAALVSRGGVHWASDRGLSAACVVAASGGYPGPYVRGHEVTGVAQAELLEGVEVFHAGTALTGGGQGGGEGHLVSSGGRVVGVTGVGRGLEEALARAYQGIEKV
ncbi:unnamed protein product, partial [Discosporangium mesarthrocarpum]